ncbi:MAG: Gfo/Idh/MocA family oxidoreductase [Bacillota bacterium]|nr:Gfo/Idh/MocA family oxidoreductase [Bacillota bacterium]
MHQNPVTAVIVGGGHRSQIYAEYALLRPDELRIVAVAEPDPERRHWFAERFGLQKDRCFENAEEITAAGRLADAAINGTMDHQHVPTSLPLLELGYGLLLEKPFALNTAELKQLSDYARNHNSRVMICHVLRYAPFYRAIYEQIAAGAIGDIVCITMEERIGYGPAAVSYVRGKWANRQISGSPMLLAKACHDLDLLTWFNRARPERLVSLGAERLFHPSLRPTGATGRCFDPCPHIDSCPWSAKTDYLEHTERYEGYIWTEIPDLAALTESEKRRYLHEETNWDRCVWASGRDNIDWQSVTVRFADRSAGVFTMSSGASKPERTISIVGSRGQIEGNYLSERFTLRQSRPQEASGYTEVEIDTRVLDLNGFTGRHGGANMRMMQDFVRMMRGQELSFSATKLDDSITGHLVAMKAVEAMDEGTIIDMDGALQALGC